MKDHLALLKQGTVAWDAWRDKNADVRPDLSGANLSHAHLNAAGLNMANLSGANLHKADLCWASLSHAELNVANLSGAKLIRADLSGADLSGADLGGANLSSANLSGANLSSANLNWANLRGASLGEADLFETVFANVDLTETKGLESCVHHGPCIVDHRTLERSKDAPINFWRGCGLPEWQIATIKLYQPELSQADINDVTDEVFRLRAERPIQLFSCFVSYSSKDREFARRLHDDLQNAGVRLWFDEHDLKTGDRLRDVIDRAIRTRDKLLLILSEASIASQWVENEVETALEEERASHNRKTILFPINIDDEVMSTNLAWARLIRRERRITDMKGWSNDSAYQKGFDRLLRDLRAGEEDH